VSKFQMLMICRAFACGFLLFPLCIYGQGSPLERRASDFDSRGVGLTETLLKFSHEEHLPMAIEYVDQASMDQPIDISVRNKTIRQALNSILLNGTGYGWRARNEIIEITNKHASKRAAGLLNSVIPVFKIADGETVQMASAMLWWELQIALDPSLKGKGFAGHTMGASSAVKPARLHNRTVREILSYIVLNSRAEGWVVAGPPECLGFTPYCGLWYIVEQEPSGTSYQIVLKKVRENL
jgi:hypothetical protein